MKSNTSSIDKHLNNIIKTSKPRNSMKIVTQ